MVSGGLAFHFTSTVHLMPDPVNIDRVYVKCCWHVGLGREDMVTQQIQPYTFVPFTWVQGT